MGQHNGEEQGFLIAAQARGDGLWAGKERDERDVIGRSTSRLAEVSDCGEDGKRDPCHCFSRQRAGGAPRETAQLFIASTLSFQFLVAVSRKIRVSKSEAWGRDPCWAPDWSPPQSSPPPADHAPPFLFPDTRGLSSDPFFGETYPCFSMREVLLFLVPTGSRIPWTLISVEFVFM